MAEWVLRRATSEPAETVVPEEMKPRRQARVR
jgi:hypothetical protein